MKNILLNIFLFSSISIFAQYNPDAPWMQALGAKNGTATLAEMKASFDDYWKTHDQNIKGSGHKPFMRYYTNLENHIKEDGTIENYDDLMLAFNQKKQNRSAQAVAVTSDWTPIHGTQSYINTGSWSSGQGRVSCITVDPSNANTIYVGTPAGGIWKSIDGGLIFVPLSDDLPQIGVNSIAVDYNNSNIVYIATGDRDGGSTSSEGVYKSINGGITWALTGLTKSLTGSACPEIYINPTNSNMLWCATNNGVFRTSNAGTTWTKTLNVIGTRDLKIKPNDPTTIYTSTATVLYKSTDSGATFTQVGTGLPATAGRMAIAVTAADPTIVYALSVTTANIFQGIYKSIDSGATFTAVNTTSTGIASTQAYYDMALTASPTNANEIFTGFLNIWKSVDGGVTMTQVNNWSSPSSAAYSHADIHFLRYYGNKLYCGSDGGIYVSSNGGTNFTDLTKSMQIGQPYKISVAKQSSNKIISGLQDNGGHVYNGSRWQNFYGADGMDVGISPTDGNLSYGFVQYGQSFYKSTTGGASGGWVCSAPTIETGTNDTGGKWVTPLAINSLGEVYSAYKNFYKLVGTTWTVQNTTPNTIGATDAELIAIDPSNNNNIFIANDRELYKSTDKGLIFTMIHTAATNIVGITVHSTNSNIIYYNTSSQVMKSINGGTDFTAMTTSGMPSISRTCITHQNNAVNSLYLSTTLGVYYYDDIAAAWSPFETGLPNVKVTDLEINYIDNNITAGTYGRGVWRSPLPATLASNEFEHNNFVIYPNPSSDIFNIKIGDIHPQLIEVTDILGKIIISEKDFDNSGNEIKIDMTNITNGVYFIKIATDNKSVVKKIIKN
jgi:Secretion system C-terminal sorting domain